ncbi:MAG: efflux RND transporter periplasmic adaptor subunit [Proteobacteria bacterium]|nr:efflux RND transporter periplasmic adaptor subunit [Pseudomonadota bacterium]
MRRRTAMLAAALGILALGAAAYLFITVRPIEVAIARPETGVPIQVFGVGTVEAHIVSEVGFEVGGALVDLRADHGDSTTEGTVLARLDAAAQEARVAKAGAVLQQARANLERARAAVEKARALVAQKHQVSRRRQELVKQGTVSIQSAEEAETEAAAAAADVAVTESEVRVAQAAVADAEAQHRLESVLLDHYTLKAPYDAVVIQRHKELGAVLVPGERLFKLVDPRTVWGLVYIDEASAGGLRVGQPAEVRLRSLPRETFSGTIARIGLESDRVSEERRVYIRCTRCPETVYLGEQMEAVITTATIERAILVPQTAVDGFDGSGGTIWTVEDGRLARRQVRFGQRTLDGRLEIVAGLAAESRVVGTLRPGLREGRSVRLAAEDAR